MPSLAYQPSLWKPHWKSNQKLHFFFLIHFTRQLLAAAVTGFLVKYSISVLTGRWKKHRIIQQLSLEHILRAHLVQLPQSRATRETITQWTTVLFHRKILLQSRSWKRVGNDCPPPGSDCISSVCYAQLGKNASEQTGRGRTAHFKLQRSQFCQNQCLQLGCLVPGPLDKWLSLNCSLHFCWLDVLSLHCRAKATQIHSKRTAQAPTSLHLPPRSSPLRS